MLQYLYLEGNDLSFLPEDFFKVFLQLKWLDLRNNKLCHFPTMCLGEHACLRNILLGNNMLKCLPLELGEAFALKWYMVFELIIFA